MRSDDDSHKLTTGESEENITQPTITAVFRLLREVQETQLSFRAQLQSFEASVNSRLDSLETRVGSLETRVGSLETRVGSLETRFESLETRFESLETRFESLETLINARFAELTDEFKAALLQLSDRLSDRIDLIRVQTDAGYEELSRRLRRLESKAS